MSQSIFRIPGDFLNARNESEILSSETITKWVRWENWLNFEWVKFRESDGRSFNGSHVMINLSTNCLDFKMIESKVSSVCNDNTFWISQSFYFRITKILFPEQFCKIMSHHKFHISKSMLRRRIATSDLTTNHTSPETLLFVVHPFQEKPLNGAS
jgi:hypothetical protein